MEQLFKSQATVTSMVPNLRVMHITLEWVIKHHDQHRVEAYLMGAPQRHGHNLYEVNAAIADADFAKNELGFDDYAMTYFEGKDDYNSGVKFNQTFVSDDAKVNQYGNYMLKVNMKSFISLSPQRTNLFHKPLIH